MAVFLFRSDPTVLQSLYSWQMQWIFQINCHRSEGWKMLIVPFQRRSTFSFKRLSNIRTLKSDRIHKMHHVHVTSDCFFFSVQICDLIYVETEDQLELH